MTLTRILANSIKAGGPISIADFQRTCMSHPQLGYYTRARDGPESTVLGKHGDFVTSPEISQTFGELLALWYITRWQAQGQPKATRLVELGPGRGTLMSDMLRTFSAFDSFAKTIQRIDLVETSKYLRSAQETLLTSPNTKRSTETALSWHDSLEELVTEKNQPSSDEFVIVLAHEFFDALPAHTLELRPTGWHEVMVDVKPPSALVTAPTSNNTSSSFRFTISTAPTSASILYPQLSERYQKARHEVGSRMEVSLQSHHTATMLANLIGRQNGAGKGAGLIIDYGDDRIFGDSFRGFRNHALVDPLSEPGLTDLTFNVDFGALREAMTSQKAKTPVNTHGPISQRMFLLSMGLGLRLEKLMEGKDETTSERILSSAERLVDKTGMGTQYKVFGVTANGDGDKENVYPFGDIEKQDS